MKILQKNSIPGILMVASLVLLAAFQAFWLRKEYFEQKTLLQKESFQLFQATIHALEDSVLQQKVSASFREQNPEENKASLLKKRLTVSRKDDRLFVFGRTTDSTGRHERLPELLAREMKSLESPVGLGDSVADAEPTRRVFLRDSAGYADIEIRIMTSSDKPDSIKQMVSRILKPIQTTVLSNSKNSQRSNAPSQSGNRMVIRLGNDSLKLDDLRTHYAQRLQKADLSLPFTVRRNTGPSADSLSGSLSTMNLMGSTSMGWKYLVSFSEYRPYLYQKITPQILFSVFLLAITALAFAVIYQNMQRQQRLMTLKNDFISNMTHELKTPIATVSVALEALQNFGAASDPDKAREYLAVSKNEVDRLAMLVDKVLKTAQFEQHSMQLLPELLDAEQLVRQVLYTMTPQLEKYGAYYTLATDGADFSLSADRIHLTNVLYNLLDNALKYSKGAPKIAVRLSRQPDYLCLEVTDSGIGIPEAYRDKIFEKFFRVPTGDIHNVKGYGLGLSYVASVAKSHNGRVEVESEPGKGSRFRVMLPTRPYGSSPQHTMPLNHDPHQITVR